MAMKSTARSGLIKNPVRNQIKNQIANESVARHCRTGKPSLRTQHKVVRECISLRDPTDCLLEAYDCVAKRAYEKFIASGEKIGGQFEDWLKAEAWRTPARHSRKYPGLRRLFVRARERPRRRRPASFSRNRSPLASHHRRRRLPRLSNHSPAERPAPIPIRLRNQIIRRRRPGPLNRRPLRRPPSHPHAKIHRAFVGA